MTQIDIANYQLIEPPVPPRWTEKDMLDRLMNRYSTRLQNGNWTGPKFMRAQHVSSQLTSWTSKRIADFIAADMHGSGAAHAPILHGHEVKVSRSDFLAELRDPRKAEAFRPYMHYWWLVVSDKSILDPRELPKGWGLMVAAGKSVRVLKRAPINTPEPMPNGLMGALLRATVKTEKEVT